MTGGSTLGLVTILIAAEFEMIDIAIVGSLLSGNRKGCCLLPVHNSLSWIFSAEEMGLSGLPDSGSSAVP
jgi:hypothetical protein